MKGISTSSCAKFDPATTKACRIYKWDQRIWFARWQAWTQLKEDIYNNDIIAWSLIVGNETGDSLKIRVMQYQ